MNTLTGITVNRHLFEKSQSETKLFCHLTNLRNVINLKPNFFLLFLPKHISFAEKRHNSVFTFQINETKNVMHTLHHKKILIKQRKCN